MAIIFLFTFTILLSFLLGALSHLRSAFHQRRNHNNLSEVVEPLITLHQKVPHLSIDDKRFRLNKIKTSMDEKAYEQKPIRRKSSLQHIDIDEAQKQSQAQMQGPTGQISSPTATATATASPLKKSSSTRTNCLCSPTTHVGSFRCRLHRHGSNFRRGHSVGSDLSELANKFSTKSSLTASSLRT